jgi:thiol:disulfide interchange protein DsbD
VAEAAPGAPFDVAIQFALPEGAYLYWENPGETGRPPQVVWTMPEGFAAGPLRFPAPKRLATKDGAISALEGSPILLATITPPVDLDVGAQVEVAAEVSWQTGGATALTGSQTLSLKLPVAAEAVPAGDDDAFVFRVAKRLHPVPTDKATNITLKAAATQETIKPGDAFEIVFDVKLKPGWHTQSHKPLGEFFVPTTVFPRQTRGIEYSEPIWPEPQVRVDRTLGRVSEFAHDFTARVPVKMVGPTASAEVTLSGLFTYQACNEQGQCHPPEAVEWSVALQSQAVGADARGAGGPTAGSEPPRAETGDSGTADVPPAEHEGSSPLVDEAGAGADDAVDGTLGALSRLGLFGAIIAGLIGGLILNIMPCVLPVISIKVLSFVQQAGEDHKRVMLLGLTFALGIIVSFWVLAGGILAIQAATDQAQAWGAFFQLPGFVIAMIVIMFVFALNLFGVFEVILPGRTTAKLADATAREGFGGAFMKGVLATLLATPCTAPFLAPAISFALAGNPITIAVVFTSVGVGMALPYILLTARPGWMKYIPKPGNWMVAFKQFMGFLLIGTAVWLLSVLSALRGAEAVVWTSSFLAFVALGCWVYGKVEFNWSRGGKVIGYVTALASFAFGGWFSYGMYSSVPPVEWVAYEPGLPERLAADGHTVYVDYTAAWCLTCQANKKVVFGNLGVLHRFEAYGVVPVKADFTNYDAVIAEDLRAFRRDAVPLNVIYPSGRPNSPIVLPVVLTPGRVLEALEKAGPSTAAEGQTVSAAPTPAG